MQIANSVALVTGGASGLGKATACGLVAAGARVVLVDLPGSPGAETARSLGAGTAFAPADVTDADSVSEAVAAASALGPLRIVVNCAGVVNPGKVLGRNGSLPLQAFETVIRVNLIGTFNVLRLAATAMAELHSIDGERGVIVNTASIAAFDGQVGQPAYAASKGGIAAMTLPIARELATHQIRVMAVAPGIFDTPMMAKLSEEARASLANQIPHPSRLGDPAEYAALVRHIIENPMLNGEVIRLDGAVRMAPR